MNYRIKKHHIFCVLAIFILIHLLDWNFDIARVLNLHAHSVSGRCDTKPIQINRAICLGRIAGHEHCLNNTRSLQ